MNIEIKTILSSDQDSSKRLQVSNLLVRYLNAKINLLETEFEDHKQKQADIFRNEENYWKCDRCDIFYYRDDGSVYCTKCNETICHDCYESYGNQTRKYLKILI